MDVVELLEKDHEKVKDLLEKVEKTTSRGVKTREELYARIRSELELHTYIEEQILYPRLKKEDETKDLTFEAVEEHRLVKQLLQELSDLPVDDDVWQAKMTLLKEMVEHHIDDEEEELFPEMKAAIPKDELEQLGERMAQLKAQGLPNAKSRGQNGAGAGAQQAGASR